MRGILLASCPFLLWVIAAVHLLLMSLCLRAYHRTQQSLFLLSGLIVFGLFYDALILAAGCFLQAGPVLLMLSSLRFVFHGALIPLIFPICAYALDFGRGWKTAVWVFTGILIVLGIAEGLATDLAAQHVAGIVRYTSGEAKPAWAGAVSGILSYGTVIPLILAGIVVWVRQKTPFLFLSGFLMFLFSALGPATGNFDLIFYISMYGEVLMALFFFLYARFRADRPET